MRHIVLDANVLISFLTDRDEQQQKQAATLFRDAVRGEHVLVLPQVSLLDMVHVLLKIYRRSRVEAAEMLNRLLAMPGVVTADEISWAVILVLWPNKTSSLTDAAIAAATRQGRYDAVATFDVPFSKLLRREGLASYWTS